MTETTEARQAWTLRVGDTWNKQLLCVDPGSPVPEFDEGSLLVQIRTRAGVLVASSGSAGAGTGVIQLSLEGSDLNAETPVIEWQAEDDTSDVEPGRITYFEASAAIEGRKVTIYAKRRIYITDEIAEEA